MKLYLIRHTSVDVPQGVCYGQTDVPLKESFKEEALAVFNKIKTTSFDCVFTSPLSRCLKLVHYCGFTHAIIDERLKELNFGQWEMKCWDEIEDPHLQRWYQDWLNLAPTGGESFVDLYARFTDFIKRLPTQTKTVALFTHGGIINCARVYAGVTTIETMFDNTPCYGSVTELELPAIA